MSLARRFDQRGRIIVLSETTDEPIEMMGRFAGECWGANTKDHEKNFNRGIDCLKSGHGRVMEYPQIYLILDGWSARVLREVMRHNGGDPTYLQASTRYINYQDFSYVTPPAIEKNEKARVAYNDLMANMQSTLKFLEQECGIKREDAGMVLPLGMTTKVVMRTNLRMLYDMAKVRKCTRAYWEFRELFKEIEEALCIYSDEWKYLIEDYKIFRRKCEWDGGCTETNSCGFMPKKKEE